MLAINFEKTSVTLTFELSTLDDDFGVKIHVFKVKESDGTIYFDL